ncbi:MAG: hypothetical protein ICV51_14510 [Flavisolibacter sp.]|nr:hypothetical protein [Flavisolibacter sp.]
MHIRHLGIEAGWPDYSKRRSVTVTGSLLRDKPEIEQALTLMAIIAKKLGARHDLEHIRRSALMNSLSQSGATDWADLKEQLHFIADLFLLLSRGPGAFQCTLYTRANSCIKTRKNTEG